MGLRSRNKGARNERLLVEHLKDRLYTALRVPLSGAMKGYKCDVTATKNQKNYTFELKVRANEYASIYHLYNENKDKLTDIYRFQVGKLLICMSSNVDDVVNNIAGHYVLTDDRAAKKIAGMHKLLNGAQYLVIRGDRLGFLFLEYA